MKRAARSPIMIVGALVLPETSVGMMEASATRKPSTPRTRKSSSTTASASVVRPHLAGAGGMKHGFRDVPDVAAQRGRIFLDARFWQRAALDELRERRRLDDAHRQFDAANKRLEVGRRGKCVGDETRGIAGLGRAQPHRAARLRPQHAGADRNAVAGLRRAIAEAAKHGAHMELHVGLADARNVGEAAGLDDGGGEQARAGQADIAPCGARPARPLSCPSIEIG